LNCDFFFFSIERTKTCSYLIFETFILFYFNLFIIIIKKNQKWCGYWKNQITAQQLGKNNLTTVDLPGYCKQKTCGYHFCALVDSVHKI
jgi:hypothetical protein